MRSYVIAIAGLCIGSVCVGYASHAEKVYTEISAEKFASSDLFVCTEKGKSCRLIKENHVFPKAKVTYNPPLGLKTALNKKEVRCLAKNIREEAMSNSLNDMIAIAQGTINRVKSTRYPNTICKVIYQKGQMSWTKVSYKKRRGYHKKHFIFAKNFLMGKIKNPYSKCSFTNWFNAKLDSIKTFNYKKMMKNTSCVYKPSGTPHFYIAYK